MLWLGAFPLLQPPPFHSSLLDINNHSPSLVIFTGPSFHWQKRTCMVWSAIDLGVSHEPNHLGD
jgi:hypothetical protein